MGNTCCSDGTERAKSPALVANYLENTIPTMAAASQGAAYAQVGATVQTTAFARHLYESKRLFLSGPPPPPSGIDDPNVDLDVVVHVGNEAGDLDTIVSSLASSYASAAASSEGQATDSAGARKSLHVAVVPFPRADFALRRDASLLLSHAHIDISNIVFSDENPGTWPNKATSIVLTDHNSATSWCRSSFGERVIGIVDHHQDSGDHLDTCSDEVGIVGKRRNIDFAGSTCTLVTRQLLSSNVEISYDLATILIGTICSDCRGLHERYKRSDLDAITSLIELLNGTTEISRKLRTKSSNDDMIDSDAASLRSRPLPPAAKAGGAETPEQLGQILQKKRKQVDGLSAYQLLTLDCKDLHCGGFQIAVPSVALDMTALLGAARSEDGLARTMEEFASKRGVDLVVALTKKNKSVKPKMKGVVICPAHGSSRARKLAESICSALEAVPDGLPRDFLQENPLFAEQGVDRFGFGISFVTPRGEMAASAGMATSKLKPDVTRKTMLPVLHQLCSSTG